MQETHSCAPDGPAALGDAQERPQRAGSHRVLLLGGLLCPSRALQTPPRGHTLVHTALLPRGTHLTPPGQVYNNATQGFRARHTLTMAAWLLAQILKSTASATHPP